jgi:hypothetical protein
MSLVQIEEGYRSWRMRNGTGEFLAKKTAGGLWYYIILSNGHRLRHTADVVERLAEPIPVGVK